VILLLLLFSCFELMIPKSSISRFVRLAFGLILLSLLLIPALQALFLIEEGDLLPELREDYAESIEENTDLLRDIALQDYRQQCAADLEDIAARLPAVRQIQAQVETDDQGAVTYVRLQAVCSPGFTAAEAEAALNQMLRQSCRMETAETDIVITEETEP